MIKIIPQFGYLWLNQEILPEKGKSVKPAAGVSAIAAVQPAAASGLVDRVRLEPPF